MKILRFLSTLWLAAFLAPCAHAQITQPVPSPAPVYASYLAGYGCLYTFAGTCPVALSTAGAPYAIQANTGSLLGFSDSQNSRYGIASVGGYFNDKHYLPTLSAFAHSSGTPPTIPNPDPTRYTGQTGLISDANISAVAKYRYNGKYTTQLSLQALLETQIYLPNNDPRLGHSMMQIGVFTGIDYNYGIDGICPLINYALGCHSSIVPLAQVGHSLSSSGRWALEILYTVHPGDEFYVAAFLDANVCCNGIVDSSHTMTMQFSDTTDLELLDVPGAPLAAVDEPPSILLAGIAFLAFLFIREKFSGTGPGRRDGHDGGKPTS